MDFKRRENAYRFSYCLYAYVYRKYHLKTKLPLKVDYEVPKIKIFSEEVGEAVSEISENFHEFLVPVLSKIVPKIRLSAAYFYEYVNWYLENVLESFFDHYYRDYSRKFEGFNTHSGVHLKFLSLCAFIANLVIHSFAEGCYHFTPSAPTCLAELLLRKSNIYDEFYSLCDALCDLNHFCVSSLSAAGFDLISLKESLKAQAKYLGYNFSPSYFECFSNEYIFDVTGEEDLMSQNNITIPNKPVEENSMRELQHFIVWKKNKREDTNSKTETLTNEWFDSIAYEFETFYSNVEELDVSKSTNVDETNLESNVTCIMCKNICLDTLGEFIEDFKETHYEAE